jgi:hypothetical protein
LSFSVLSLSITLTTDTLLSGFGKIIHSHVIALWITFAQPHKNGVESLSLEPILFSSGDTKNPTWQIKRKSVLVTEKATLKAISVLENLGSQFPAVVAGVDRATKFIKCVHAKRLPPTTDMKPGDFYMLS